MPAAAQVFQEKVLWNWSFYFPCFFPKQIPKFGCDYLLWSIPSFYRLEKGMDYMPSGPLGIMTRHTWSQNELFSCVWTGRKKNNYHSTEWPHTESWPHSPTRCQAPGWADRDMLCPTGIVGRRASLVSNRRPYTHKDSSFGSLKNSW